MKYQIADEEAENALIHLIEEDQKLVLDVKDFLRIVEVEEENDQE
jgi:hypothetical protein